MTKKRGFFKQLCYDAFHIHELMPSKIEIYENQREGISAFRIRQPKNQYVPSNVDYFEDSKNGIFKLRMDSDEVEEICSKPRKRLEKKEGDQVVEILEQQ